MSKFEHLQLPWRLVPARQVSGLVFIKAIGERDKAVLVDTNSALFHGPSWQPCRPSDPNGIGYGRLLEKPLRAVLVC